jgi:hypothetical protein
MDVRELNIEHWTRIVGRHIETSLRFFAVRLVWNGIGPPDARFDFLHVNLTSFVSV